MINELVHQSIINYRTNAWLAGLAVDSGELTNQEINSYIVFILVALEKRNKETSSRMPISRKVKESDEYKKIKSQMENDGIDENAIEVQLNTLIRTSTNQLQSLKPPNHKSTSMLLWHSPWRVDLHVSINQIQAFEYGYGECQLSQ